MAVRVAINGFGFPLFTDCQNFISKDILPNS